MLLVVSFIGLNGIPSVVAPPVEIIVDNTAASFSGTWPTSTSKTGYYGTNYQYNSAGSGADQCWWYFSIPTAGNYEVYAQWTDDYNRATDAPYTVYYGGGGQATVDMNQQANGGSWQLIGTYSFTAGSFAVRLTDDADNYVIADAIRVLEKVATTDEIIVDNPAASYVGSWPTSTSTAGFYGSNYQFNVAGIGTDTATWTFIIGKAGDWDVFAMWTAASNRASNAKYTVSHADGTDTVSVDQRSNGGSWELLGRFRFDLAEYYVRLTDNADGYVIADAIRLVYAGEAVGGPGVINIPSSAFMPRYPLTTNAYYSGGYVRMFGDSPYHYFNAPVFLPDGVTVTNVTSVWRDTDATYGITSYLYRYSLTGGASTMAIVSSTGSAGYGTTEDTTISYAKIDNTNYFYTAYIYFGTDLAGTSLEYMGMIIEYE